VYFRRRAQRIASGVKVDEKDLDAAAKQTAQDFEDMSNEELKLFTKAQRITRNSNYYLFKFN
jgi:bacillopeptidase F (M6 metalloprotease family)